ncbi:MAG TPA: hypothetical protein PKH24_05460 [Sedimentisphaerales bacterium]|jgi:hypothetical protein|nr:hypothetical protein [Sedimentisphaerales bacterium]HNU29003.1 hypothetical protein [Sedimentisphaerales bacterium]
MANEIQADYASGSVLYAIIRKPAGQVWHPAGETFEDWATGGRTIGDYAIVLTDKSGNRYVGDFDADIPAGCYGIQVFRQTGSSPADGDTLVCSREIRWTGVGELTSAKILANKAVQDIVTKAVDYYDDDGVTILLTHNLHDDAQTSTRTPE